MEMVIPVRQTFAVPLRVEASRLKPIDYCEMWSSSSPMMEAWITQNLWSCLGMNQQDE